MKKATIYMIAKEAGVSVTTVSRFFNNPDIIREATKEKISSICQKYDYELSSIASSISTKKTKTIAIMVSGLKEPAFVDLIDGAEYILSGRGYCLGVFNASQSIKRAASSILHRLAKGRYLNMKEITDPELMIRESARKI